MGWTGCCSLLTLFKLSLMYLMSYWSFGDCVQVTDHPPRSIHTPTMRTAYIGSGLSAPKVFSQLFTLFKRGKYHSWATASAEMFLTVILTELYRRIVYMQASYFLKCKPPHSYIMWCDKPYRAFHCSSTQVFGYRTFGSLDIGNKWTRSWRKEEAPCVWPTCLCPLHTIKLIILWASLRLAHLVC